MIKQKQLYNYSSFSTCLCSLLDIDIKNMNVKNIEFLFNIKILIIDYLVDSPKDVICIASGFHSLEYEKKYLDIIETFTCERIIDCPYVHNVIWKNGKIIWDPNIDNIGIISPMLFSFIIPTDPSMMNFIL